MPKLSTVKRGDSRFYINRDGEKVPGVTSVINMIPKPFLQGWYAKMTAEWCADNAGPFAQLLINGERKAAVDMAKGAARRSTAESSRVGTAVHDYVELYARGEAPKRAPLEVQPFEKHVKDFHDRYQPEYLHVEDAVWSDTHKYAGSFDWIAKIDGEIVMGDTKTTRSGVHPEVALQLAAYRFADKIVRQDGTEAEMPDIQAGAVFHLRPEGWKLVPVRIDRPVFEHFLHLRETFDWVNGFEKSVLGDADFDSQSTSSTGSQRRAS